MFSDKTGTLTCNVMEFKKFTAGVLPYGTGEKPVLPQLSNVCFQDPSMQAHLGDKNHPNHDALVRVLLLLSVCHTIVIDERKGTYNAASPDELALVNGAKQFGYEFKGIDKDDNILIEDHAGRTTLKYRLLNICEFNSTRKRASVIVQDPRGQIVLMCKGADSVIYERLSQESLDGEVLKTTQEYVDAYAVEGLRTLFLAEKVIPPAVYEEWNAKAQAAKLQISNREEKVAAVDELIETELELIGATAIEDRLQDKVAETIQFMKHAGIKVWVLTGDKIETAVNIGFSAGLLDANMTQHLVQETDVKKLRELLDYTKERVENTRGKQAIVVAGASLLVIDSHNDLREAFLGASDKVDVVLACRVSPKQKADIVNLIRRRFPQKATLSIGDGANDVNMILQAHVGVGILGKEGQQAARSADFAIGQFKFLKPLMFIHGREAYRRNALLILYTFYKNVLYVTAQFFFGFYSAFSGQPLYDAVIY